MLSFKEFIKLQENRLIAAAAKGIVKGFGAMKSAPKSAPSTVTSVPSVGRSAAPAAPAPKPSQPTAQSPAPPKISGPDYSKLKDDDSIAYFQTGNRGPGERPNSLYSLNSKGSTTAYRTPSNAPKGTAPSMQPTSGKTIFVEPQNMDKFSVFQGGQSKMRFEPHPDKPGFGRLAHAEDYGPLKAGSPVRGSEEIPFSTRPALGSHVIEINDYTSPKGIHFGSAITHIGKTNYPK